MSMNSVAKARTIVAVMVVLLGIVPISSTAGAPRYEAVQLVRYVLESDRIPHLSSYWAKVRNGSLYYDNEYRHPTDPPGPTPVDCTDTRRIGVTFIVTRRDTRNFETVWARIVWTHSNFKTNDASTMWTHTDTGSRVFHQRQDSEYYSYGLVLKDELRVDGIISVRVLVGGNIVLENAFYLSQCERGS